MRLVIVTSADDMLGGVFAQAYYESGGPAPVAIFVMEDRPDLAYPGWALPWVLLKLFGIRGSLRIAAARLLRMSFTETDKRTGLHKRWLQTMSSGAPSIRCRTLEDPEVLNELMRLAPDILVSIGAPRIIKSPALAVPRLGSLNVHNGALPRYRGHFGTFWEMMNGEERCAISVHEMTAKVDSGRLAAQDYVDTLSVRSFLDLLIEKKARGGRILADVLRRIGAEQRMIGSLFPAPDSSAKGEYFGWPSLADIRRFKSPW